MDLKGVNYDVGTAYLPAESSRSLWSSADVIRDLRLIRRELHCNSVNLYGSDLARLTEGAALALDEGLAVSIQPRLIDGDRGAMLHFLEQGAREAERLRRSGPVTLNTGCELSLFTAGFLPGRSFLARIRNLVWSWTLLPWANARLNRHLRDVVRTARTCFGGPITYSAGTWERVDWSAFDLVGVNLYRDRHNRASYVSDLRHLRDIGKKLVVTEFGCGAFEGAERLGGAGWLIIDHGRVPPTVKPGYPRSEEVQAREVGALLDIFEREGIHGAYVFDFMQASHPHHSAPQLDLDRAGYGLVKVRAGRPEDSSIAWEPKQAFQEVARRYRPPDV